MIYGHTLANWLGLTALTLAMTGCPAGDDGDTGAETNPLPTTSVGNDTTTTGDGSTSSPPATTTMSEEESTASVDSSTGAVACDPPCEAGEECIGGTCFDMGDSSSSGEPPPTSSDYGPCDMCAAGEMPVAIMGVDGFCFCSPECDGMSCPAANEGSAMPVCALGFKMGAPPTQCALVCEADEDCPMGASCESVGMASLCTHPVPA